MPVAGAPWVGDELRIGEGFLLLATVLAAPTALAMLVEPWAHAWSDRWPRRPTLVGALGVAATALLTGAAATGPVTLACAIAVWGTASGIACGVAQGALVARGPTYAHAMTRWSIASALGDLTSPLLVGTAVLVGAGWRGALAAGAAASVLAAVAIARAPLPAGEDDGADDEGEEEIPIWIALREALRHRRLLAWLAATVSCTLLDEIVVVLVALRLAHDAAAATAELTALLLGGAAGLLALERGLARWAPRRILAGSAAVAAVTLVVWMVADDVRVRLIALAVLGAAEALHWPLAKAEAFACLPGRPGLVNALESALGGVDVLAPLAIGAVVSTWGVEAALGVLLLEPLCVGVVALLAGPAGGDRGRNLVDSAPG